MSTFLNRFSNDATQRIEVDSAFAGTPIYHDGLVYGLLNVLVVNYAGTLVGYLQGIGQTLTGELMVFDASAGLPADTFWQSGLPVSAAEHRLCVDPTNAVALVHDGIPFTTVGAVAVNGSPAPPAATISSLVLDMTESDGGPYYYSQLYYGASGALVATVYTAKATFNSDNPAAALETFAGIAPATGNFAFAGGTVACAVPATLHVTAAASLPGPSTYTAFDGSNNDDITITFSPPVSAVGINLAYVGGHATLLTAKFYDGATLLQSTAVPIPPAAPLSTPVWSFFGYAVAGGSPPAGAFYEQEANTDIYIQEVADSYIQE